MIWSQTYLFFDYGPVLSAPIAAFPIYVILILLGILRKPAWVAGLAGLATAALIAVAGYGTPASIAGSAPIYGAGFGIFPIAWSHRALPDYCAYMNHTPELYTVKRYVPQWDQHGIGQG